MKYKDNIIEFPNRFASQSIRHEFELRNKIFGQYEEDIMTVFRRVKNEKQDIIHSI